MQTSDTFPMKFMDGTPVGPEYAAEVSAFIDECLEVEEILMQEPGAPEEL